MRRENVRIGLATMLLVAAMSGPGMAMWETVGVYAPNTNGVEVSATTTGVGQEIGLADFRTSMTAAFATGNGGVSNNFATNIPFAGITRTIDVSDYVRPFPDLAGYRNTSIQKAPAPALAALSARELGRAKITRCWLNLDEMWDYRTRQYDDNYRIGVHKYDDVPQKARETWGSVTETRVRMDDYLKAFGAESDAVMLTIRRYERDILDKKLGVTMDDWKAIFKHATRHAKEVCPHLRYIEVCNEYSCFIGCTDDEYYEFYRRAYEAVNEVNAELKLAGCNPSRVNSVPASENRPRSTWPRSWTRSSAAARPFGSTSSAAKGGRASSSGRLPDAGT